MKISAALIMKNEEENLPRLLKSLQGKFDEIVVVDTGSTDSSKQIAKEFGCKVYEREWKGFADARNYAISKCSGEWIWHFDADFELEDEEFKKFYHFIKTNKEIPFNAFNIYIKNYGLNGQILSISSQAFIHRNIPEIKWIGDIHERIDVKVVYALPVFVNHFGYQRTDIQLKKAKRNLELLKKEIKSITEPSERFIKYFYFLQTYSILMFEDRKYIKALKQYAKKFVEIFDKKSMNKHFFSYGMTYVVDAYLFEKDYKNALCAINKALKIYPFHPDYLFKKGEILFHAQKFDLAKKYYLRFFESINNFEPGKTMAQVQVSEAVDKVEEVVEKILDKFTHEEIEKIYMQWKKEKNMYKNYLVLRYFEKYKDTRFEKFFQKLKKLYSNRPFFQRYLIIYFYNKKDYVQALVHAFNLLKKEPNNRVANEVIALINFKEKNFIEAKKYFEKTLLENYNIEIFSLYLETLHYLGEEELIKKLQEK